MTDDLISRPDCIAAIEAAQKADDAIALVRALPAADVSALGAVAMRDQCMIALDDADDMPSARYTMEAIPLPTHADLLAAALALPEVAAMYHALMVWDAAHRTGMNEPLHVAFELGKTALSALEARHE